MMITPKTTLVLFLAAFFSLGMGPRPPADTTPPQVSITAPANNSTVSGSISIQATATDNKGISKVEFYVDNALKATSYGLPYAYSWNSVEAVNGSHILKVIAFDASKNTKHAQVSVTVNNAVPPPPISEGEQIKVPSAVVSSYYNSSRAAAQTIDNNLSTYWEGKYRVSWFSSKTITSWWLRLDLDKPYELFKISIYWYKGYGALDYSIQGSNDYQTWANIQAGLSTAAANTNPYQTDHVLTGSYRYIRININKAQASYPRIYEVKLYSVATNPPPDTTAPTTPLVSDDGATSISTTQLHAEWSSSDPESGIVEYQYKITRDSAAGIIVVDWASVGTNTEVTKTSFFLSPDKTYFFSVKARNAVGLWSAAGYSDGIKVVLPPELSVEVAEAEMSIGTVKTGSIIVSRKPIVIVNNSPSQVSQTYALAVVVPAGWTVSQSTPDPNVFVLNAAFDVDGQGINWDESKHALSTNSVVSSAAKFAGDSTGFKVPYNATRKLWIQFKAPTSSTVNVEQRVEVKIIAQAE